MILRSTPIEHYEGIDVKREDLCVPAGAPPFSKIRGLVKHLGNLKRRGYAGAAYVETSISMAGWGVAWACHLLEMKCLIFNPIYKNPLPLLRYHREQWKKWGAKTHDLPAGRAKVNYYIARKQIPSGFKLLPLGLPLPETISATHAIAKSCVKEYKTIVACVGSGTIASGIYRATVPEQTMYGVLCRSGDLERKKKQVAGSLLSAAFTKAKLEIIDVGFRYTDASAVQTPFPCHPYYDAKAWEWLVENKAVVETPVLFWNIGSTGDFGTE